MRPPLSLLLVGATFIALSPIFVRLSDVGPTASAFWRVALAAPVLWPLLLASRRANTLPISGKLLLGAGLAFAGDLAFWHWSIRLTSVANATLLANLAAPFVTAAVWIFWGLRPSATFAIGLGAALVGVLMLVHTSLTFSPTALLGDAFGVITALFYAAYLLSVKSLRDRGAATLYVMAMTSTLTAILLFPAAIASGEGLLPASLSGWLMLAGLAWISHCAGQGLIAYSLAHLPAAFSSVSLLFQPVMASLFAWLLLSEPLAPLQIGGGLVVLAGIYLARRGSA
jgi:drug/metabolite transporter (DMT)-like permease